MAERLAPGTQLDLDIERVAAGGSCVARHGPSGRVVFVRHTLPGERVRAVVTEDRGGSYLRADAVEILTPSPDRVEPPCEYAGPGRCGGCDWQHASGAAQRESKAAVIRDQFARIGGLGPDDLAGVFDTVQALPGGLLGWRTRIAYAIDHAGRPGLRRHASHEVQLVSRCLLGAPGVGDSPALDRRWPGVRAVEVVRGDDSDAAILAHRAGAKTSRGGRPRDRRRRAADVVEVVAGPQQVTHQVDGHALRTAPGSFWQVHPAALQTFAAALLASVAPAPGDVVLELYSGAGALTSVLADAVGPRGTVLGIEGDAQAVADAKANLTSWPWAGVRHERVDAAAITAVLGSARPDVVVLDPPRAGAGAAVLAAVTAVGPRVIGYVSCDPATLARDVAAARAQGWRMSSLRAFDAYPMTHHVECVAALVPDRWEHP